MAICLLADVYNAVYRCGTFGVAHDVLRPPMALVVFGYLKIITRDDWHWNPRMLYPSQRLMLI